MQSAGSVDTSVQNTRLQDFGAEMGGGGHLLRGRVYTPNFTVHVHVLTSSSNSTASVYSSKN